MNLLMTILAKLGVLKKDLDYHLLRASMVVIFLFFGYQKWFPYEAQALIPYISHGPLIFWMYPVFGIRGATYFLGVSEWLFGALLFAGFWNKKLGVLGALGALGSFIATSTIIPLMPNGWAASAGGFPAMTEHVAFLMKDLVLLAVSFHLLKEDLIRASELSALSEDLKPEPDSGGSFSQSRRPYLAETSLKRDGHLSTGELDKRTYRHIIEDYFRAFGTGDFSKRVVLFPRPVSQSHQRNDHEGQEGCGEFCNRHLNPRLGRKHHFDGSRLPYCQRGMADDHHEGCAIYLTQLLPAGRRGAGLYLADVRSQERNERSFWPASLAARRRLLRGCGTDGSITPYPHEPMSAWTSSRVTRSEATWSALVLSTGMTMTDSGFWTPSPGQRGIVADAPSS
jgi:uncharacterized membrane protein YkgB